MAPTLCGASMATATSSEQTTMETNAGVSMDKASSQVSMTANSSGANTATAHGKQSTYLA